MRKEPPTIHRPLSPPIYTLAELSTFLQSELEQLARLIRSAPELYTSFDIPKSSGGTRTIRPPKPELRDLQRKLLDALQDRLRYPRWMTGGVPKRSIFDHARPHVGREVVATFDVHSFFPSTTEVMVTDVLARLGFVSPALDAVVRLVMRENQLPQGAPTSLMLANLSLERADRRIDAYCRKRGFRFTRYVDDMAVSGGNGLAGVRDIVTQSVQDIGYLIAPDKIKTMSRGEAQLVTKLRVNDVLRPTKDFIGDVKEDIWLCLEIGASAAAMASNVSVLRLKHGLTGRVAHIAAADSALGKKLRGMLCGVKWGG